MKIAVKANAQQKTEWLSKPVLPGIGIAWVETEIPSADAYFDLGFEEFGASFSHIVDKPVFLSDVLMTSKPSGNTCRINAWNTFLSRDIIEVAGENNEACKVLEHLGWKYQQVPDVPGMIAARTISMIINEAYFALGEAVSTKQDIDTAMKLGTNYPFGPFEWSEKIGLHNIYRLLLRLSETDSRYQPAPGLIQELKSIA